MRRYLFPCLLFVFMAEACHKNSFPSPEILQVYPDSGNAAAFVVTITGLHFDSLASNIAVSFNGVPAVIYQAFDTIIYVYVPTGATTGKIKVTVNGHSTISTRDFVILPGTWTQKANLPDPNPPNGRYLGVGFAIDNKGYMGLGYYGGYYDDLYEYDPAFDHWTKKSSLGLPMYAAVSMVIHNKAYVGIGVAQGSPSLEFFEYDPAADAWTRKKDFPGMLRSKAFGLGIGQFGYVGFGYSATNEPLRDFWQYNPATDSWIQKAGFPGAITEFASGFSLDSQSAYLVCVPYNYPYSNTVWKYDSATDTWTQKNPFPGQNLDGFSTMVLNGVGYVMGGGYQNWVYDQSSDHWKAVAFVGNRWSGSAFAIGNAGYYGLGIGFDGFGQTDLWQFVP